MAAEQMTEWGDLRIFLQVARAGQMAAATRALALDHSTVSRRVARLEEKLGVPLFDRAGRRLRLTAEGAKLLAAAEKLESIILRDVLRLGEERREITGSVRIGTPEGIGAHYLAPRVPRLLAAFPGLEVELVALPRRYSLAQREVDVAVTMDRPDAGDVRFKRLTTYTHAIYAAAGYFQTRARPKSVADLPGHRWCGYIDELLYTDELDLLRFGTTTVHPDYRTTSLTAQLQAARSGSVLAVLPRFLGDLYGELEKVLPGDIAPERTYWMSVHRDLADSPRVRAVCGQIERWVQEDRTRFLPDGPRAGRADDVA